MSGLAQAILEEIGDRYLTLFGASDVSLGGGGTADISDWIRHGVPGISLNNSNEKYFYFHHTEGDTLCSILLQVVMQC